MLKFWGGVLVAAMSSAAVWGQQAVPAGTVLPVMVTRGIAVEKVTPGQLIQGNIMQDVPLAGGRVIRAGAKITGSVIAVSDTGANSKQIRFSFDRLENGKDFVPVATDLRAVASLVEVNDAQIPKAGPDGTPPSAWTTVQVGGEVVYRGGGAVMNGLEKVGRPAGDGVLARLDNSTPCGGPAGDSGTEQALWIFSSDACGSYGFSDLKIVSPSPAEPVGQIAIVTRNDDLRAGSGMLVRVIR